MTTLQITYMIYSHRHKWTKHTDRIP